MKTYNNGPRKGMMYGGAARRKPMMYGGMATKKPRKKMQMGGQATAMTNAMTNQQKGMQPAMGMPKMMAGGGKAMLGDLDKDGKMSGYEKARQNAINKNMKNRKA
jgi:imidazole glycerol phosphate synthase subunit HisF